MDDFLEGIFSEDSDGWDHGEAEAALYSMVHHSEETYNTSMLEFSEGYIRQRNNVNRWEVLKQIRNSGTPSNYILHPQNISPAANHIPFVDNNISSISKTMFGQRFNSREQNVNYHRTDKPQNMNERIRNVYQRKSNLVPIFVQRNDYNLQYSVDPQAILKVNNFSSFETPRNVSQIESEFNRKSVGFLKHRGRQSGEGIVDNSLFGMEQNRNPTNRTNSYYGLKVAGDPSASTSKEKNASNIPEVGSNICPPKRFNGIENHNSKICAVEKNAPKIVEVSSTTTDEVVIISDTDGNEDHSDQSVVEVCIPAKPSPPVVALDSSDESETGDISNKSLILNVNKTNKKLITNSPHTSQSTTVSSKNIKNPLFMISSTSKEIKKKTKKKKKRKLIHSFECKSWTTGMLQFYNTSWGGETYDHQKLLQEMTSNPNKWKILDVDKYGPVKNYGPRIRCANCSQFGHMAKQCPDPKKMKCCSMCGQRGHVENECPNKLCLKCGRPAPLFNEGCPSCWNHSPNCASCGGKDHFNWLCPDVWRKLHSVVSKINAIFIEYVVFIVNFKFGGSY
ncbi:Uncharacterized protein GBIM_15746 [Gryllus bimaculatus]|nr:Uncharacterized protein GBIM_15746 [Gryllus bimaculatus]